MEEVPELVLYVKTARHVSLTAFEECLDKHPEYFPEEVAHRKKWERIPGWVHEVYQKTIMDAFEAVEEKYPNPNKGRSFLTAGEDVHAAARAKELAWRLRDIDESYYLPYLKKTTKMIKTKDKV